MPYRSLEMTADTHQTGEQFVSARLHMVDEQLKRRGIHDAAVLAAMRTVPRHEFVRPQDVSQAYGDHPLSIGHEQTISQPYIVASMTQELHLDHRARVLEVGTGCGYQTAVLAEIVKHVYTVECIAGLFHDAMERLERLSYTNITGRLGDGTQGWAAHVPYDGILVAAAATTIPEALTDQLADPGRMVIPIGPHLFDQQLVLVEKKDGLLTHTELYGVRFVPLRMAQEGPTS